MNFKLLLTATAIVAFGPTAQAADAWRVEVNETAGIQRFKYPVSAEFDVAPAGEAATTFQLRDSGKPIEAQFTRLGSTGPDKTERWSVDCHLDLAPQESRVLSIMPAASDESPPRRRGLSVEQAAGTIRVRHPTLEFSMAEDLRGLFEAIRVGDDDWLVGGSAGLSLRWRDGRSADFSAGGGSPTARVIKSGPLAARVEFAASHQPTTGEAVKSRVVLDFPLGKSWVKIDWTLDDPADLVAALSIDLRLRLDQQDKSPVLADVGADGWTYAPLRPTEKLAYRAGPAGADWQIDRVIGSAATPFARPAHAADGLTPRGWAHLMDRKRVTAIAVDRFAADTRDGFDLSADGSLQLSREFPAAPGGTPAAQKRLSCWLHVVSFPPQVGAATSPQSMLAPLEVRILAKE